MSNNTKKRKRTWTNEQFLAAFKSSTSIRQILNKLSLRASGGNYASINRIIKELGLDTKSLTGQGWRKGSTDPVCVAIPLKEILVENSAYQSNHLRKRLLKEGILQHRCSRCKLTRWEGETIPLELDHINGIRDDNRIENLRLLCPNCHALTPTYRGKNIKKKNSF